MLTLCQITGGLCALFPPYNISAAASSPQEILPKPLKRKESSMYLIFIVVGSFPFPPPSQLQQICAFLSNGFVQLHDKSHPPKRQSSFLCMSP